MQSVPEPNSCEMTAEDSNPLATHLSPSARTRRQYGSLASLQRFAAYTIDHLLLAKARREVLQHLFLPRKDATWTPVILVIGPAGVGKTTLLHALERDITRRLRHALKRDPGRIAYVSSASEVADRTSLGWKMYCAKALEAMNEPLLAYKVRDRADIRTTSEWVLRETLVSIARHRRPAAFLIDEAQQLTSGADASTLLSKMDYLKRLADATRVPHVLIGNYGLCLFRSLSGQLGRRTIDIHFRRYDATRQDDLLEFKDILHTFACALPFAAPPPLVDWWEYLYTRSAGCIGLLKPWLEWALFAAMEEVGRQGTPLLTEAILRRTGPAPSKTKRILSEALEGEAQLEELESSSHVEAEVNSLRSMLGLTPPMASEPTPQVQPDADTGRVRETGGDEVGHPKGDMATSPDQAPAQPPPRQRRRRPGRRNPSRDPVGVEPGTTVPALPAEA